MTVKLASTAHPEPGAPAGGIRLPIARAQAAVESAGRVKGGEAGELASAPLTRPSTPPRFRAAMGLELRGAQQEGPPEA